MQEFDDKLEVAIDNGGFALKVEFLNLKLEGTQPLNRHPVMRHLTFDHVDYKLHEWSITLLLIAALVFGLFNSNHAASHSLTVLPALQASNHGHLEVFLVQQGLYGGEDHRHDVIGHVVQLEMLNLEFKLCILFKDPRTVLSRLEPLEESHFHSIDGQE